jgi:hypothetical protein
MTFNIQSKTKRKALYLSFLSNKGNQAQAKKAGRQRVLL